MHESTIVQQIWTYSCAHCRNTWDVRFEEWHVSDGHGGDVVHYRRNGQPCVSPWIEMSCPDCGAYSVTLLPSPTTAHPAAPAPAQPSRPARIHRY